MKKTITILIVIFALLSYSIPVFATDVSYSVDETKDIVAEGEKGYETLSDDAVLLSYNYSDDFKKIEIHGNISYNALIKYGKYRLEILRVAPYESVDSIILSENADVIAEMDIAAKFDFSIKVDSTVDLFSKYAVVLRAENKPTVLASSPKYVNITADNSAISYDTSHYKGIGLTAEDEVSVSGDMGFGSVVIPVYYDRLLNESSKGYMYPFENTYCYFDTAYINELDMKIKTYSMTGAKVYLQLLLPVNSMGGNLASAQTTNAQVLYAMPDVYDKETVARISTYVRFLSGRYDSFTDGIIGGIIVGKNIDVRTYNYNGGLELSEYAKRYAFYLNIVANSARMENKKIDIVIPFSNFNSYDGEYTVPAGNYAPSDLLKSVIETISETHLTNLSYSMLIESDVMPIELTKTEDGKETFTYSDTSERIGVNNLGLVDNYISHLKTKYQSVPNGISYLWKVPDNISGKVMKCAYAYSYYSINTHEMVSSFITEFPKSSVGLFEECEKLIRSIDTTNGFVESNKLLKYFGADNWADVVVDFSDKNTSLRTEIYSGKIDPEHYSFIGAFSYTDFSLGNINGWNNGAYGKNIRLDYGNDGQRALHQTVSKFGGKTHSDMFHLYEYDENFVYTPILRFDVRITDSSNSSGELYEVTITIGKDGNSITESFVIRSGEISQLWFYIGDFSASNKAGYIKLSTRSITGTKDEYSVWLYDIVGFSEKYNNKELEQIISSERSQIRNQTDETDADRFENALYWIVFAIIMIAITIGGVMFTIMRRDDVTVHKKR